MPLSFSGNYFILGVRIFIKEDIMKIDNYSVSMNAQYYKLEMESTKASVSQSNMEFEDKEAPTIEKVSLDFNNIVHNNFELNTELAKGILQNINNESIKFKGDIVEISHTYVESQSLNFSMAAKIQAEGKEIELTLDVSLSRSFMQHTSISHTLSSWLDPLVISLDGSMPSLSSNTFSFDLDSDGKSDQISQLNAGNGFLVYDKNENNTVDDSSELFGTKSGNGFADLSKFDEDENSWIDENDPIFDKLQIWIKNGNKDELIGLGEVGIGAIFLGNTETPFSLKSETNALLGEIRKSSFVLFEDAEIGVISQIDFAVYDETKDKMSVLDALQKNLKSLDLAQIYSNSNDPQEDKSEESMAKLQEKIKELEVKLRSAEGDEKASIQVQIGQLFSQMMSMLEQKFT